MLLILSRSHEAMILALVAGLSAAASFLVLAFAGTLALRSLGLTAAMHFPAPHLPVGVGVACALLLLAGLRITRAAIPDEGGFGPDGARPRPAR